MTRREELEARAQVIQRQAALSDTPTQVILDALLQVERECLERIGIAAREFSVPFDIDEWTNATKKELMAKVMLRFADWCREQQKGVEG